MTAPSSLLGREGQMPVEGTGEAKIKRALKCAVFAETEEHWAETWRLVLEGAEEIAAERFSARCRRLDVRHGSTTSAASSTRVEDVLAELERLEKAATPAPWVYDVGEMLMLPSPSQMHDPKREAGREGWCGEAAGENDGQYMVAARNHLPLLLALARLAVEAESFLLDDAEHIPEAASVRAWLSRFSALESGAATQKKEA